MRLRQNSTTDRILEWKKQILVWLFPLKPRATDVLPQVRAELERVLNGVYFDAPMGIVADKLSEEGRRIIEEFFGKACGRNVFAVVKGGRGWS